MKINKFKNSFIFKVICFLLIFSILPWNCFFPITVKADNDTSGHDAYFVKTLLDKNGVYIAEVMTDSNNSGKSQEEKMMAKTASSVAYSTNGTTTTSTGINWAVYSVYNIEEGKKNDPFQYGTELASFSKEVTVTNYVSGPSSVGTNAMNATSNYNTSTSISATGSKSLDDNVGLIFSFPSYQRKSGKSYIKDQDRAITVSKTLTTSLNSVVSAIKSSLGDSYKSSGYNIVNDSIYISKLINPAIKNSSRSIDNSNTAFTKVSVGGVDIYYANFIENDYRAFMKTGEPQKASFPLTKDDSNEDFDNNPDDQVVTIDGDGNLLMYVVKKNAEIKKAADLAGCGLVWAMPKGYLNPVSLNSVLNTRSDGDKETDGKDIWGVGNERAANQKGDAVWLTIFSLAEFANTQAIIKGTTLETDEKDINSNNMIGDWIYGLLLNVYSGILNLLQLSTITELIYGNGLMSDAWWNVVLKYHLIFQIVSWMVLILAVAKILIQVNFSTVNPTVKISVMDTGQKLLTVGFSLGLCIPFIRMLEDVNELIVNIFQTEAYQENQIIGNFGIAGLVILLGYFGITFTMNCIYIMRSIMIAILTASAPLFITSMAFSGPKQKGLFDNWLKEITANIFMQSVHAFAFAFLFDVMEGSKLIIRLVIYFSLLPIVDAARQLVFGQAGTFAVSQGQKAAQTVGAFVAQTAGGVAKGAANAGLTKYGREKGLPVEGSDNPENSTGGENKAGKSGDNLLKNAALVGDHLQKHGGLAGRVAGTALKAGSKAGELYKSTGGVMGNAVTQANLGNVGESVSASNTYGEGVAKNTERTAHDISDKINNSANAKEQNKFKNEKEDAANAHDDLVTAQNDYSTAKNDLDAAKSELSSLGNKKGSKYTAAKRKVKEAQARFNNASTNLSNAQDTYNQKQDTLRQAQSGAVNIAMKDGVISSVDSRGNLNFECSERYVQTGANGETYVDAVAMEALRAQNPTQFNGFNFGAAYDAKSNSYNLGRCGVVQDPNSGRVKLVGITPTNSPKVEGSGTSSNPNIPTKVENSTGVSTGIGADTGKEAAVGDVTGSGNTATVTNIKQTNP